MNDQITFIHAADLHLDSPFKGLSRLPETIFPDIQNSPFHALDRLVALAIEKRVDFVLLVGDLFDNERQSLKAQIHLRDAFAKLNQYNINVYLSYGNHDYLKGNQFRIEFPPNVYCFPNETISSFNYEKDGQKIATIYGFSYEDRAVLKNKSLEYSIEDRNIPFHIATLHGSITSNTEHDTYAPFLLSDLTKQHFDYWALGHIHQRQVLHETPYVIYPGNIQGRHRNEAGDKGCYHVTLSKHSSKAVFFPLQSILFKSLKMDLTDLKTITEIEKLLKEQLDEILMNCPQLIHLTLKISNEMDELFQSEISELIALINDVYIKQKNWVYIYQLKTSIVTNDISALYKDDFFIGEVLDLEEDEKTLNHRVQELYNHRQAKKYLEPLTSDELVDMENKAKRLLMNKLGL